MLVRINKKILALYNNHNLDLEVSLNWILGYLNIGHCKNIPSNLLGIDLADSVQVQIPDSDIKNVVKHLNDNMDLESSVNLFLLCSFILDGGE